MSREIVRRRSEPRLSSGPAEKRVALGYSHGSIVALCLGVKLKSLEVPVRYLGIADLPLFPFGLKPKPGSFPDSMIPLNQPDLTPSGGFSFIFFDPLRALFPPPKVTPPTIVAGRKRNFFQVAGNGAKLTNPGRNPAESSLGGGHRTWGIPRFTANSMMSLGRTFCSMCPW